MAPPPLTKLAYQTLQQGKSLAGLAHKELSSQLMKLVAPEAMPRTRPISSDSLRLLRRSMADLEQLDWQDAEDGIYPESLLFDIPWLDYASHYPLVWLDLPAYWQRRRTRNIKDLPKDTNPEIYPAYYLQNFHHQTDGYLSDHSASLYDLQVEILFNGTADCMRRRLLAPLRRGLKHFKDRPSACLRVLDIATGTGRTLKQIRAALPELELIGLDLSSAYLGQANRWLNNRRGNLIQLVRGNGEDLPFSNGGLQAVTCVFLLHELPASARQNVLSECWRVLEPGGVLVLADSIQLKDSPQFTDVMENFQSIFHEPFYNDYINDDIDARLHTIGFEGITAESHFMTRVWSARKPGDASHERIC
ncbi:MAG: methyltransferase domain-containing protein [Prochlorococcus sp.]|nr:class I SAM-dependent methyltransferase [Prochlorococcaceae cyanobacterium Fu_MAG_50]